ncbi:MAG: hypothetical protein AB2556_09000 [Candidatus Thiodiazotropha sp.]
MENQKRRNFIVTAGKLIAGSVAVGSMSALSAAEHMHHEMGAGDGLQLDAAAKNTCATCQYWGGMRRVSKDKKSVVAQSMGWCNNPDSLNHMKMTAADHQMKKEGIWKKWAAL